MFPTKRCFEKYNKKDRSSCSQFLHYFIIPNHAHLLNYDIGVTNLSQTILGEFHLFSISSHFHHISVAFCVMIPLAIICKIYNTVAAGRLISYRRFPYLFHLLSGTSTENLGGRERKNIQKLKL